MITELFGMPGAGKSTIASRLSQENNMELISISSTKALLGYNILFFAHHPIRCVRLFILILTHSSTRTFWYKFTNFFLHANAKYQKARHHRHALIDQGHMQSLMSISETPLTRQQALYFMRAAVLPETLVIFRISKEDMLERIEGRHYIVREKEGEASFLGRLAVMERNANMLLEALPEATPRRIVLSASMKKEDAYTMLVAQL